MRHTEKKREGEGEQTDRKREDGRGRGRGRGKGGCKKAFGKEWVRGTEKGAAKLLQQVRMTRSISGRRQNSTKGAQTHGVHLFNSAVLALVLMHHKLFHNE